MLTFHQIFSIVLVVTIPIFYTSKSLLVVEAKNVGFNVDLVHRDSPKSPFYNHSLIPSQRVAAALRRSFQRIELLKNGSTPIIPDLGEFLMKMSIGTPPVEILPIADTGSDLTWIQCEPCANCSKQITPPIFNPDNSSTYKTVPCTSELCHSVPETSCNATTNTCQYSVSYVDKSLSHGDLATEIVTFDPPVSTFPNIFFGCANGDARSGVAGLGGGPGSLISQMSPFIGGKFSYCLVPFESTKSGKFYFGQTFPITYRTVSTPLVPNYPSTFYYITLTYIFVGSERIVIPEPPGSGSPKEGNMIIDTGTTLTNLPLDIYNQFEAAVKKEVKLSPVDDPQGILSLCYKTLNEHFFPVITLKFPLGEGFKSKDLILTPSNTFVQTSDTTKCLAFSPTENDKPAVLGNFAQKNLFVSYDLEKKTVSFRHTDCEKE